MSNYNKVQFISWEVYTGPAQNFYAGLFDPGSDKRTGILGQCVDIEARLSITDDAISQAEARSDRSDTTLKVFMAPEFLYRGAGGAYLHDLLNGWDSPPSEFRLSEPYNSRWPGLFGGLRSLAAKPEYNDWVFVFGTAISASFPTREASPDKWLLDPRDPGEIYNSALILRGGAHAADCVVPRKHYISPIDFLTWTGITTHHTSDRVTPLDPRARIPLESMGQTEGSALFRLPEVNDGNGTPIDFGIEICLDHLRSGGDCANHFGRIRTANQYVKIQLVPSGGMELWPASIRLQPAGAATPQSYAFNCDGLGALDGASGSHTQVWNGANGADPVPLANRLVEASSGAPLAGTVVQQVIATAATAHGPVSAHLLWNNGNGVAGAGSVRVLTPLAL